jgi:hypothetical protein
LLQQLLLLLLRPCHQMLHAALPLPQRLGSHSQQASQAVGLWWLLLLPLLVLGWVPRPHH